MKTKLVTLKLDPETHDAFEKHIGLIPKSAYIRMLIEKDLKEAGK